MEGVGLILTDKCTDAYPCGYLEGTCNPAITWFGLLHSAWSAGLSQILSSPINPSVSSMPASTNKFGYTAISSPAGYDSQESEAEEHFAFFSLEYYVEEVPVITSSCWWGLWVYFRKWLSYISFMYNIDHEICSVLDTRMATGSRLYWIRVASVANARAS